MKDDGVEEEIKEQEKSVVEQDEGSFKELSKVTFDKLGVCPEICKATS